jgi:DNA polymerase III gamma/tau subunit
MSELIKFQRDIALLSIDENMVSYGIEEKTKINELISKAGRQAFLQLITKLSEVETNMRWASDPSILFETGLIKICFDSTKPQINTSELITNNAKEINSNLTSKVLTILKENGKIRLHADLISSRFELQEDGIVHIIFNNVVQVISKENFMKDETKIAIKSAVKQALGKEVSVKYDNLK